MRLWTSGGGAGRIGRRRRNASQASTSARSHTTQRGVRRKRFGNSPRCSISQMVLSASGTIWSNCAFLIDRVSGGSDRFIVALLKRLWESKAKADGTTSRQVCVRQTAGRRIDAGLRCERIGTLQTRDP